MLIVVDHIVTLFGTLDIYTALQGTFTISADLAGTFDIITALDGRTLQLNQDIT